MAARSAAAGGARIPSVRFDLRPESAERGAFPRAPWLAAMRRALADAPDADLGYGSWAGAPRLRAVLAAYLGRARGVVALSDNIVVTAGITQAIALLAGAAARPRGAPRARRGAGLLAGTARSCSAPGSSFIPVDVDDGRAARRRAARSRRTRSSPPRTSSRPAVLSPGAPRALLAWAAGRAGRYVLEDDYDSEYAVRQPAGCARSSGSAPDRVVYLG